LGCTVERCTSYRTPVTIYKDMRRSIDEIVEYLALHPNDADVIFQGVSFVPLLALLEHPYAEVSAKFKPTLVQAGFSDLQVQKLSLDRFVSSVLLASSSYWIDKALDWIDQGLPITQSIEEAIAVIQKEHHLPQHTRHKANRILTKHINEHYDRVVQELVDVARRAAHIGQRPFQVLVLLRDGWKAKSNGQLSFVGFVRCVKTAFDIPLREARTVEEWQGLSERGRMSDEEINLFLEPWIEAYRKRVS
jgi:hypothetical protein